MQTRQLWMWGAILFGAAGCGGYSNGSNGTNAANRNPTPASTSRKLTISQFGLDQHELTVNPGDSLQYFNSDQTAHQLVSDPHPQQTNCPDFNGPVLQAGQSYSFTVTSSGTTCGIHDTLDPTNVAPTATFQVTSVPSNPTASGGPSIPAPTPTP